MTPAIGEFGGFSSPGIGESERRNDASEDGGVGGGGNWSWKIDDRVPPFSGLGGSKPLFDFFRALIPSVTRRRGECSIRQGSR